MVEFLAAVPAQVWVAGLLAGAVGGLCAALRGADQTETATEPATAAVVPCPDLDDTPWDRVALDDDPIWAVAS
jgi:hypothetical protein